MRRQMAHWAGEEDHLLLKLQIAVLPTFKKAVCDGELLQDPEGFWAFEREEVAATRAATEGATRKPYGHYDRYSDWLSIVSRPSFDVTSSLRGPPQSRVANGGEAKVDGTGLGWDFSAEIDPAYDEDDDLVSIQDGMLPLYSAMSYDTDSRPGAILQCLRLLLHQDNMDVNQGTEGDGLTPLAIACIQGYDDCVTMLFDWPGIKVNQTDNAG